MVDVDVVDVWLMCFTQKIVLKNCRSRLKGTGNVLLSSQHDRVLALFRH